MEMFKQTALRDKKLYNIYIYKIIIMYMVSEASLCTLFVFHMNIRRRKNTTAIRTISAHRLNLLTSLASFVSR